MIRKKCFYNLFLFFIMSSFLISFFSFAAEEEIQVNEQSKQAKSTKKRKSSNPMPVSPVTVEGDEVSYLPNKRMVQAKGHVKMKNNNVTIYCDDAQYSAQENRASINGNVRIYRKNMVVYGKKVEYDFKTNNTTMLDVRMISSPLYGGARLARSRGKEEYLLREGNITTCDLHNPHYKITAKKMAFYPGRKVVAKNILIKVGDLPVFYFPYLSLPIKDWSFPFELMPGKKKEWGYYLLTRYRYHINEENKGDFYLDWYEQRGFGRGIAHQFNSKQFGQGTITYYGIIDQLYDLEKRDRLFDYYPDRKNESPKYLINDRYKAQFAYYFNPIPEFTVRSEINKFSDKYFVKDFFYREYDRAPEPISFTLADYSLDNCAFSVLGQERFNRFFTQTEYLPQYQFDLFTQKIGNSPIYIRSKNVGGSVAKKFANTATHDDVIRFYSDNLLSSPQRFKWLTVNPFVGGYTSWYSRQKDINQETYQGAFHSGIDFNTRLFKVYDINSYFLGEIITVARHVLTPNIRYEYIHPPVVPKTSIAQFDELDDLKRKEKIVFTFENKIQTKGANNNVWDFLFFSPSVEYVMNEKSKGSYFSKVKTDLEIYPRPGITFNSNSEYDCDGGGLKDINADISFFEPKQRKYSISVGQRYTKQESNQTTMEFTYKLSEKWEWRNYLRYLDKGGKVQEQQYVIRRDLHCWWLDLGVNFDKDRNYTVWAAIYLKAFPDIHFGFEQKYDGGRRSY